MASSASGAAPATKRLPPQTTGRMPNTACCGERAATAAGRAGRGRETKVAARISSAVATVTAVREPGAPSRGNRASRRAPTAVHAAEPCMRSA
eukprot:15445131-Alexandrium_andersonii.AAC.1